MSYSHIELSGKYQDGPSSAKPGVAGAGQDVFRYDHFAELAARIRATRRIKTVLVEQKPDFAPRGFAALEGVRRELVRLVETGKEVLYCCEDCDETALYLASAAHSRFIHPEGELRFLGFARRFVFFKRLLDRFGVRAVVIRRGRYKSAGDPFRTDGLDEANREQYTAFYTAAHRRITGTIADALGKTLDDFGPLTAGHILPAEQAVEHGWMTEAVTSREIVRRLQDTEKQKQRSPKLRGRIPYRAATRRDGVSRGTFFLRRSPRVAVLFLSGALCDGESRRHPVFGQCSGDVTVAEEIRKLSRDKRVKGVVLRVDSPGGSALASETIRRELAELREKKPLVVSMGNVAGSGGYWVALEADHVCAEELTLTGSIGVLMLLLEGETPLKRQGITSDAVETAPYAELGTPLRKLRQDELHMLETRVEHVYEDFLARVAAARAAQPAEIAEVAAGRVWTGAAARQNGLLDEVGGLDAAIDYLAEKLGARRLTLAVHPKIKPSLIERLVAKNLPRSHAGAGPAGAAAGAAGAAASVAGTVLEGFGELHRRPLALMPFGLPTPRHIPHRHL